MQAFVIGATGYIGGAVVDHLLEQGHDVVGLVRSSSSAHALEEAGAKVHHGDIGRPSEWMEQALQADAIVFAWLDPDMERFRTTDTAAVRAVLQNLKDSNKAFLYVTGSLGTGNTGPETEVDESTPADPPPFLAWRSELESEIRQAARTGVRTVVVRAPMVYGRTSGFIAESLITDVSTTGRIHYVGDGDNLLAFVHVDDLAALCVRALASAPAGSLYLASSGESLSSRDFSVMASSALGGDGGVVSLPVDVASAALGPFAEALTYSQRLSNARARQELGWKPTAHSVAEELKLLRQRIPSKPHAQR
ncbi:NAD-dependent epimerase/dehydratase family protein [Streptomyces sp. WSLK1-3]|uniref:NAD-dependent epimerase/dehydratase family protein n=1 Tax=Streptomyces sp. WSLK1-3 TaxID=3375475 RepID=UPI00379EF1A2